MNATNVFLSFLVLFICTNSFFCAAAEVYDPVLDSDGDEVKAGSEYYILPADIESPGGGLRLDSFGPEECNLSVAQAAFEQPSLLREISSFKGGFPLTFTPYDNDGVIRVSTDLNFKFVDVSSSCQDTFVWRVSYDESVEKYIIDVNGVEGNPGINTIDSWFKISKYGNNYKLVYNATVCDICHFDVKVIGTFGQTAINGTEHQRLFLNVPDDKPLEVYFKKVKGSTTF